MADLRSRLARVAGLRFKLASKFTFLFLMMALIVAATGTFGIRKIAEVGNTVQGVMKTRSAQEKMAVLMKVSMQETRVHLLEAARAVKVEGEFDFARDDYEMGRDRFRGYVTLLLKGNAKVGIDPAPPGSKLESRLNEVQATWEAYEAAAEGMLARKLELLGKAAEGSGDAAQAAQAALVDARLDELINQFSMVAAGKVDSAVDEVLVTVGALMNESRAEVASIQRRARIALLTGSALAVAFALLLGLIATRRMVINPIMEMKAAAARIAAGDLTSAVAIRRRDEIASLGETVNAMTANLKEMFLRIREVTASLSQATENIVTSAEHVRGAANLQQTAIERTAGAIGEMGASTAAMAESSQRLSKSAADTSAVITETKQAINSVADNTDILDASSEETAASIQEMVANIRQISGGIEHLSASSERISASITQVTASTREIEHHAGESVALADRVLAEASGKGATAARAALDGIVNIRASVGSLAEVVRVLGKRSLEIGTILTIIDEIADRTNLLALNAAILSAQAGVHGRGFAVVATEIKHLAEKTSASVKEISALISSVQGETNSSVAMAEAGLVAVDRGLKLVRDTEAALGGIAETSVASAEMAKAIQRSTGEESQAIGQIALAIREMADQLEKISQALQEQGKGSAFIIERTERMRTISRHVRGAVGEQREGSAHMVIAIDDVARQAGAIAHATGTQQEKNAEIVDSMGVIRGSTANLVTSSNEMKDTISALTTAAHKLHDELQKFTV